MDRRRFINKSGKFGLGFVGLQTFALGCKPNQPSSASHQKPDVNKLMEGYGPLLDDPKGVLNLPKGFTYKVISTMGDKMSDGLLVPGNGDGMATFATPDNKIILIRNHEISAGDFERSAFGADKALFSKVAPDRFYDYGRGNKPGVGGTSTLVYNPSTGQVEQEYLSLVGTIRNCAGGRTPWNSWVTCEENTSHPDDDLEKSHGFNFEVPASATPKLADPIPLKEMGRFNHEAICVDPKSGIVYETEDRGDGLIYRFLPNKKGVLQAGGKLQVLSIKGHPGFETRNWSDLPGDKMPIAEKLQVEWLDIDHVESPDDDLRLRGFANGAARFARGEGIWFGQNEFYFACTNGGDQEHGQIFKYVLSPKEGQAGEKDAPATLEIFIEPNNTDLVESCDNLTIAAHGDLVICEDKKTPRIVGVTPEGGIYHIAKNVGFLSEFAGATFSPDGKILFVNIQGPGMTLAIEGPWSSRKAMAI